MSSLLAKTAWPMTPPTPYSAFHIIACLAGISLALYLAWRLNTHRRPIFYRVLFLCGVILSLSELYKQLFLYYIVNGGHYDWWYFPFQLCSLPMYLCLLVSLMSPWLHGTTTERILCTFIQDFGLLGGIMALLEPSGLLHPYWTLTVHGLTWHILLIFIGLYIGFSGRASRDILGYLQTLPLFGVFCLIATCINLLTHGAADMFYIAPYYPVAQVVFDQLSAHYGTGIGIMVYLLSICLGGFLCHMAAGQIRRNHS